jgi:phosphotransferase system  glucose/maltose/N-acetylglucosamine-specific IIC component
MIKKFINAILDQTYTLLGMFVAWVVLEGSARTIVTYAIGIAIMIDATRQSFKKDE